MKILHLTIKKKWFDLIASGHKIMEYREVKDHWRGRLMTTRYCVYNNTYKEFDEIHFRNGYKKTSPFMRTVCMGISTISPIHHKPDHGEVLTGQQFVIFIGKILEVRND